MRELEKEDLLDLFKEDEGSINLYYGLIGQGKTYSATADILELLTQGKVVYCNWHINVDDFDDRKTFWISLRNFLFFNPLYLKIPCKENLHYFDPLEFENNENVVYPNESVADSLKNRMFIIEGIVDLKEENYKTSYYHGNPILKLKDSLSKQIIYFKYDKLNESTFPFDVFVDEKLLCENIERKVDEFNGEIGLNSPMIENLDFAPMVILKTISKTGTQYYLALDAIGSTLVYNATGVTILFTDSTKWQRASKVTVKYHDGHYLYSTFITLTQADLVTFSNKRIKKYRLYIFDKDVNEFDGYKFGVYVKCIRNSK